jgi:hypothetical protein
MSNSTRLFFTHGCSHTSGAELPGDSGDGLVRKHSWANQVAHNLGFIPHNIVNQAVPCSSNDLITRQTIEWCSKNHSTNPFVLVNFTGPDRIFMRSPRQERRNPQGVIRLTPGCLSKPPREAAPELVRMYKELLYTEWGEWPTQQTRLLESTLLLTTVLDSWNLEYLITSTITPLDTYWTTKSEPQATLRRLIQSPRVYRMFEQPDGIYYQQCGAKFPDEVAPGLHIGPQGQAWWAERITEYLVANQLASV